MSGRLNYTELSKRSISKLFDFAAAAKKESIEQGLVDLVNIRASQINGCAFCVDMHVKEATLHGERPLRLHHIAIWRESPLFTERERMAFEWTETLTTIPVGGVTDALFEKARAVFSEKELSDLTLLVGIINVWNRLNCAFHTKPGSMDELLGIANSGLS
jgi:AhpD family alkylhydroperoxidase